MRNNISTSTLFTAVLVSTPFFANLSTDNGNFNNSFYIQAHFNCLNKLCSFGLMSFWMVRKWCGPFVKKYSTSTSKRYLIFQRNALTRYLSISMNMQVNAFYPVVRTVVLYINFSCTQYFSSSMRD